MDIPVAARLQALYKKEGIAKNTITLFRKIIYDYYKKSKRDFPFRKNLNPYRVLVSEIMLQQTQVNRVSQKYVEFIKQFSTFKALAQAKKADVIKAWQGLGYNRRALMLKKAAEVVISDYKGKLPSDIETLQKLPGLGYATACSVRAFAFNKPSVFIETNIRTVFIHFFFHSKKKISDKEIMNILEKTMDTKKPRDWYYALMDYGTMLKSNVGNLNVKSKTYAKQSVFEGSNRQVRGMIIRLLTSKTMTEQQLIKETKKKKQIIQDNLKQLQKEGFLKKSGSNYKLAT